MTAHECKIILLSKGCPEWKADRLVSYAVRHGENLDDLAGRWYEPEDHTKSTITLDDLVEGVLSIVFFVCVMFVCFFIL